MSLFESFYPDTVARSTYTVDFKALYKEGYRGLIFDIDNTLVGHNAPADERAVKFFGHLDSIGFKSILLSNNGRQRVATFAEAVGTLYIYNGNKPSIKGYIKAMEKMGTNTENTVFIGDQLFTDVWGAKRCGIRNILVGQIGRKETIHIVFKRLLERVVLFFYRKSPEYAPIDEQKHTA